MKTRITIVTVVLLVAGGVCIIAMTKADLIEVVHAKFGVDYDGDGKADELHDVWLRGIPGDSSEILTQEDPRTGLELKYPSFIRFDSVVLQFPAGTLPRELADWHARIMSGKFDTHNCTLIILGEEDEPGATINFFECWPSALRGFRQSRTGYRGAVVDEVEIITGRYEWVL